MSHACVGMLHRFAPGHDKAWTWHLRGQQQPEGARRAPYDPEVRGLALRPGCGRSQLVAQGLFGLFDNHGETGCIGDGHFGQRLAVEQDSGL